MPRKDIGKMKLIGVTPRILYEDSVEKQFVNTRYVKQLVDRGLNVIMITTNNPYPEEILNLCDGFLITGGNDIDPSYFGEVNEGLSKKVMPELDTVDKIIVEHAVKYKKPLLGICRGHQAINVFLGGSLYQDIGTSHENVKENHLVFTRKNRLLNFNEKIFVNSYHHQAVKDVAQGLQVIATHEDGTIEAFIHESLPIIGIQWHPEIIPNTEESKMIFDCFLKLLNEKN